MHPICLQTAKAKFAYTVELDFSGRQNTTIRNAYYKITAILSQSD